MTVRPFVAASLAALLAGCATTPSAASTAHLEAQALAADRAFSSATAGRDARAFAAFLAPDAVFVGRRGVSAGAAAICADWAPLLERGGPTLAWAPDAARAAGSGDLVLTRGAFSSSPAGGGPPTTGRYVTVWQRGADGKLRVALDGPEVPLPVQAMAAVHRPLKRIISEDGTMAAAAGLLLLGEREVGGFLLVEVRVGNVWRVLHEVGSWRPDER